MFSGLTKVRLTEEQAIPAPKLGESRCNELADGPPPD